MSNKGLRTLKASMMFNFYGNLDEIALEMALPNPIIDWITAKNIQFENIRYDNKHAEKEKLSDSKKKKRETESIRISELKLKEQNNRNKNRAATTAA